MTKQTISFNVTMTIELAKGETELPRKERDSIAERIFQDLKNNGVTSDDYDGGLAGEFVAGLDYVPELSVTDLEPSITLESLNRIIDDVNSIKSQFNNTEPSITLKKLGSILDERTEASHEFEAEFEAEYEGNVNIEDTEEAIRDTLDVVKNMVNEKD